MGFAHPFHLKLAFSPKPISDDRAGQSMINYPAPPMQISRGPQLNTPRVVTVPAPNAGSSAGKASELGSSSPPPFDVKAVEAEEAAYLESNGAVIAGAKRERSPTPPPSASQTSPMPSAHSHSPSVVHQPPKTPEEEKEEERDRDSRTEAHEAGAVAFNEADELHQGQEGIASSSELSEDENIDHNRFRENLKAVDEEAEGDEEDDVPYVRKTVHQPPATPPSESPSSSSYSPIGDGES